jgi:hypothetical protein
MLHPAKLNLSRRNTARDGWRALSDLSGGALALLVWLSLWLWIVVEVVRPLSGMVDPSYATARSLIW